MGNQTVPDTWQNQSQHPGVHLSIDYPEKIVSGNQYLIKIDIEELEGKPRTIESIWVNGFMLTRTLGFISTSPAFTSGTGNPHEGWEQLVVIIDLDPYELQSVELLGTIGPSGVAHGIITIDFNDQSSSVIPIKIEVLEPQP